MSRFGPEQLRDRFADLFVDSLGKSELDSVQHNRKIIIGFALFFAPTEIIIGLMLFIMGNTHSESQETSFLAACTLLVDGIVNICAWNHVRLQRRSSSLVQSCVHFCGTSVIFGLFIMFPQGSFTAYFLLVLWMTHLAALHKFIATVLFAIAALGMTLIAHTEVMQGAERTFMTPNFDSTKIPLGYRVTLEAMVLSGNLLFVMLLGFVTQRGKKTTRIALKSLDFSIDILYKLVERYDTATARVALEQYRAELLSTSGVNNVNESELRLVQLFDAMICRLDEFRPHLPPFMFTTQTNNNNNNNNNNQTTMTIDSNITASGGAAVATSPPRTQSMNTMHATLSMTSSLPPFPSSSLPSPQQGFTNTFTTTNYNNINNNSGTEISYCMFNIHDALETALSAPGGPTNITCEIEEVVETLFRNAEITVASIHTFVGDVLHVSWNATQRVKQHEIKASRFVHLSRQVGFGAVHTSNARVQLTGQQHQQNHSHRAFLIHADWFDTVCRALRFAQNVRSSVITASTAEAARWRFDLRAVHCFSTESVLTSCSPGTGLASSIERRKYVTTLQQQQQHSSPVMTMESTSSSNSLSQRLVYEISSEKPDFAAGSISSPSMEPIQTSEAAATLSFSADTPMSMMNASDIEQSTNSERFRDEMLGINQAVTSAVRALFDNENYSAAREALKRVPKEYFMSFPTIGLVKRWAQEDELCRPL
eukprot:PhM_4_TR7453/c0_g1_i1/m.75913